MSLQKELHFFLLDVPWGTWSRGIDWYSEQFTPGVHKPIRGEASPGYTIDAFSEKSAQHISDLLPNVKLIYMIRDPIERIRSNYTEEIYGGRIPTEILLNDILNTHLNENSLLGHYHREFVLTSLYHKQLTRYLKYFSLDQILVITTESLRANPVSTLQRIWQFLNVDDSFLPHNISEKFNEKSKKRLRTINPTQWLQRVPNYGKLSTMVPESVKDLYRYSISKKFDHTKSISISPNNLACLQGLYKADIESIQSITNLNLDEWKLQ